MRGVATPSRMTKTRALGVRPATSSSVPSGIASARSFGSVFVVLKRRLLCCSSAHTPPRPIVIVLSPGRCSTQLVSLNLGNPGNLHALR